MPAVKFVPVLSLIEFTGDNQDELPLETYLESDGVSVSVKDGTLTITWPPQAAQIPVTIRTGDFLDEAGFVYPAEEVQARYVRLSQLGALL